MSNGGISARNGFDCQDLAGLYLLYELDGDALKVEVRGNEQIDVEITRESGVLYSGQVKHRSGYFTEGDIKSLKAKYEGNLILCAGCPNTAIDDPSITIFPQIKSQLEELVRWRICCELSISPSVDRDHDILGRVFSALRIGGSYEISRSEFEVELRNVLLSVAGIVFCHELDYECTLCHKSSRWIFFSKRIWLKYDIYITNRSGHTLKFDSFKIFVEADDTTKKWPSSIKKVGPENIVQPTRKFGTNPFIPITRGEFSIPPYTRDSIGSVCFHYEGRHDRAEEDIKKTDLGLKIHLRPKRGDTKSIKLRVEY